MTVWLRDLTRSVGEACLDLIDAFAHVPARTYLVTATVVLVATLFINLGPQI